MSQRVTGLDAAALSGLLDRIETREVDRALLAAPAAVLAALLFGSRLAINTGVDAPIDPVGRLGGLVALAALACAGSLLAIAVLTGDTVETVGLSVVGVFGVLAVLARPATVPAAVAIVAGSSIAVGSRLVSEREIGPALVTAVLIAGIAGSLASTVGVESALSRSIGTQLTLLGVAGTPLFLARGRWDWLAGGVGAGLVIAFAAVAPFVLGATGLVAGSIVGASVPLMALAIGGLTTTASAAIRTQNHAMALGAGLLLFAGVPATLPRALTVVLAIVLLVDSLSGGETRA